MPDKDQRRWLRVVRRTLRRRPVVDVTVSIERTAMNLDDTDQPTVRLTEPTPLLPEDAPAIPASYRTERPAPRKRQPAREPADDLQELLRRRPDPAVLADREPTPDNRPGPAVQMAMATRTRAADRPPNLFDRPPVTRRPSPAWHVWAESHAGFRREDNQDSVLGQPPLIAVADGVGGGPAGDTASMIVLRMLRSGLRHTPPDEIDLQLSLRECAAALLGAVAAEPALEGMATTLDAVVLGEPGSSAHVRGTHIGDGAVWLLEGDRPPQLLTASHRDRSGVLVRAIAAGILPYGDEWKLRMRVGDRLVIASDGFHGQMQPEMVLRQLVDTRRMPAREASQGLVRAALGAGGSDNVSVVVADLAIDGGEAGEPGPPRRW
ncbi:protein phosphatase 2C domain-containing protein [Dactylosporangium sp. AC04546]|uniref:protein phosphatase 2C domain-containing protein n=1 Tax=Dactylosporangium sp. AC04546 TaxID=2862460 RepID=UPI001EE0F29F|nr:protein phosphatase 2C domain-containing protein [Dactylosporangium sp. AC04546]WVK84312.1 protein phosphatase 2C domain-containing protein [Dactylosporangium sp. AC04546]